MPKFLQFIVFAVIATCVFSCNEPDIKLINQIKTFGPKWSSMGEKMNYIDRNLNLMEDKFESNYGELEPIFGQIPDSLRGRRLKKLIVSYKEIVTTRDSLRGSYLQHKSDYTTSVEAFNVWEKKVMNGDVATGIAVSELTKFKQTYGELNSNVEQIKVDMTFIANEHNRVFKGLTSSLDIPTNYTISLK